MPKKIIIGLAVILAIALAITLAFYPRAKNINLFSEKAPKPAQSPESVRQEQLMPLTHPLQIDEMRKKVYEGSDIKIERELPEKNNYRQFLASYQSDGLKINALLTVPNGEKPENGWPAIIFNHGYIPPEEYKTTERYVAYVDGFAGNGYIVFKLDYRGHGDSEGNQEGAYYSPAYTIDVLNAVASVKKFKDADPNKIGMWGHSMGGSITVRSMVILKNIRAGVIWAGVVGSYDDLINRWRRRVVWRPSEREQMAHRPGRQSLIDAYGTPEQNQNFWHSIDPTFYLSDISGPIQLHHGTADESVPIEFSENLKNALEKEGKTVEFYEYKNADHNISSPHFEIAIKRSVNFFDKYLK